MDNYDNLLKFIQLLTDEEDLISAREILQYLPVEWFRRFMNWQRKAADYTCISFMHLMMKSDGTDADSK